MQSRNPPFGSSTKKMIPAAAKILQIISVISCIFVIHYRCCSTLEEFSKELLKMDPYDDGNSSLRNRQLSRNFHK